MRGKGGVPVAAPVVVAALSLLFAGTATAGTAGNASGFGGGVSAEFHLKKGRYEVAVVGTRHLVVLSVFHRGAVTQYQSSARVSAGEVRAGLGRFGRIAVRFEPSGKVEKIQPFPGCTGDPLVSSKGVFVGTIRIRGEGDFKKVDTGRAFGTVTSGGRWKCREGHQPAHAPEGTDKGVLLAVARGTLEFVAVGWRSREQGPPIFPDERTGTLFIASTHETCGPVTVSRFAFAFGRESSFLFDEALTSATVKPPPPFHGTATFQRDPVTGAVGWTGSLGVSLIGGDASLTGPGFKSELEHVAGAADGAGAGILAVPTAPCGSRHQARGLISIP